VRLLAHSAQNSQALGRYLHPAPAEEGSLVDGFPHRLGAYLILEELKYSPPSADSSGRSGGVCESRNDRLPRAPVSRIDSRATSDEAPLAPTAACR
jgi:hypothetical protein